MAKANNSQNVSFGKPKVGGAVFRAPMGTPLPQNATDPLDDAYENVGYISDAGVTNTTDAETASITEWGGLTVLTVVSSTSETYGFTMIETREESAKVRFGDSNVKADELGNLSIDHNGLPSDMSQYVIESILTGNRPDRYVIPSATVTEVEETSLNSSDAKGWGVTLAANADDRIGGATSREYIAAIVDKVELTLAEGDTAPKTNMAPEETQTLAVKATPSGASDPVKVTTGFTVQSSDPATIAVEGNVITAKKDGKATVFVYVANNTLSLEITVATAKAAMTVARTRTAKTSK